MTAKTAIQAAIYSAEKWDRSGYVGASEIGGCPLKIYLDKTEDNGFRGNGKTERGNALESALIGLLKRGGMDIKYYNNGHTDRQKEITHSEAPVKVHPDGIIYETFERPHSTRIDQVVKESRPVAILEVKSVGTDRFRSLTQPDQSWVTQTRFNAYMAMVPKGLLVAVDASDLENVKEWEFEAMSETEAQPLLDKARKIIVAMECGIEPIAEPSGSNCKWCEWQTQCQNKWIPDEDAKVVEVEAPEIEDAVMKLKRAKELQDEAKTLEAEAKPAIMQSAQTHNAGRLRVGNFIAILEPRKGSVTVDTKRLLADHPEIDKSPYEKQGAPTVALKLKEI